VKDSSAAETGIFRKRVQQVVSNLLAVVGGVVSVVTLVVMLTSAGSRNWVKDHPYWVFGGFVAAIVAILVLLNFMQDINAKYSELRLLQRSDDLRPTDQNKRAIGAFLARIPPGGVFVTWLKKGFSPSSIPLEKLDALNEVTEYLSSDPGRFDDPLAARGYLELIAAAGAFSDKLQRWTSLEAGNAQRIIPIEWEQGAKYDRAVAEIQDAKDGLIDAYDAFLRTCHERGIEPA
jgi:hypothetical protein